MQKEQITIVCVTCKTTKTYWGDVDENGYVAPFKGWTEDDAGSHCPAHSPQRVDASVPADEAATYADCANDEAAAARWRENHLCLRCAHFNVCRYTPDEEGSGYLVTVSGCAVFVPATPPDQG